MRSGDAELIRGVQGDDPGAFTLLVERHQDTMVNYLTRLTGCRDRAEELAQETFVRFYRHRRRYREEGSLAAYLFRIATNLVRSDERRRRRWRLLTPFLATNGHEPAPSPRAAVLAAEEQEQVSRALASLDLAFRAPLVLREIEGLSYQQIARALSLAEGTVKSRLHRGKELLRERLAPYWNGDS